MLIEKFGRDDIMMFADEGIAILPGGSCHMAIRILIVDDHEIVRQGVRTIFMARPQWEICGEAVNGQEAVRLAQSLEPDAIVMDITMPVMSGLDATREISKLNLNSKVLIFTMHDSKGLHDTV